MTAALGTADRKCDHAFALCEPALELTREIVARELFAVDFERDHDRVVTQQSREAVVVFELDFLAAQVTPNAPEVVVAKAAKPFVLQLAVSNDLELHAGVEPLAGSCTRRASIHKPSRS